MLFAAIDAVSEHVAQFGKAATQLLQQRHSAMIVLNIGRMDMNRPQQAVDVGDDVPLASIDALAGVEPRGPPACVVKALWLSMTAAVGFGARPSGKHARVARASTIRCHRPLSR